MCCFKPLVRFAHPDGTNMFEELCHLLHLGLLSQPCDVYRAVLRVILLLRASCSHTKAIEQVSGAFVPNLFHTVVPTAPRPLLTHITLICTHWSCEPGIGGTTKGGKSVCVTEATPEEP